MMSRARRWRWRPAGSWRCIPSAWRRSKPSSPAGAGRSGENNRRQAYLPAGAIPIQNPVGTAPGFILETAQGTIIALPGVPREMEHLMGDAVLPYLQRRLGETAAIIKARTLRTVGLGESWIDERIDAQMRSSIRPSGWRPTPASWTSASRPALTTEAAADAMIAEHGGAGARRHRR